MYSSIYFLSSNRFRVCTLCVDETGSIPIILGDHEIRCVTGKTVFDLDLDEAEVYADR